MSGCSDFAFISVYLTYEFYCRVIFFYFLDTTENAANEIALWFGKGGCTDWEKVTDKWTY